MSEENKKVPESANDGRDARGRWVEGHCPNLKGRPRKKKAPKYDPSDIRHFMNTQVELMVGGEVHHMDRKAALLSKAYESAMKGSVTQQRYVLSLFENNDSELSELRQQYREFVYQHILDNPDFENLDDSLTNEQMNYLLTLSATLNHYYPGQFDAFLPKAQDEGE